jgi:hypothetical protein
MTEHSQDPSVDEGQLQDILRTLEDSYGSLDRPQYPRLARDFVIDMDRDLGGFFQSCAAIAGVCDLTDFNYDLGYHCIITLQDNSAVDFRTTVFGPWVALQSDVRSESDECRVICRGTKVLSPSQQALLSSILSSRFVPLCAGVLSHQIPLPHHWISSSSDQHPSLCHALFSTLDSDWWAVFP